MNLTVAAVVPAFNPDPGFIDRLLLLKGQVGLIVVVDDGSETPIVLPTHLKDVVLERQHNAGIANAINRGVGRALAEREGLEYLLTVDQDSVLGPDFVATSARVAQTAAADGIGVAATATARYNGKPAKSIGSTSGFQTALHVAQSGMLFPRASFELVGMFDDSLVIDGVETEWCLRARRRGLDVVLAAGTDMAHPVGEPYPIEVAGRRLIVRGRARSVSVHSSIRRYYITRNRLLVYPRYLRAAPGWIARDTLAEARTLVLSLVFGPNPVAQVAGFLMGVRDGLLGRRSKAPSSVRRALTRTR
ncbi:glycosyltransferase [Curtobacterium sp. PhB78]|uniref:glycosyltransferase n=1 Tax=Curtobacterium sp. PhB78 TaxID=2485102 RepID=UPI000F9BB66A|nr:glycosyltransferase [Curtobacterium sp. PhB78]ROS36270.1 rhamnosyltransferase [Curtobacterium sp. PhB78]